MFEARLTQGRLRLHRLSICLSLSNFALTPFSPPAIAAALLKKLVDAIKVRPPALSLTPRALFDCGAGSRQRCQL